VGPDVEIVAGGGRRLKAAVARPEVAGKHHEVVVIHEVFGDQPRCVRYARSLPATATWR
jgi:dienelactone hydrolase